MAAGSPSLATNLSYNPFGNPRSLREVAPRRTDGFSEDGNSYAVIDDLEKQAAQALEEFNARIRHPRNDIWGQVLPEDRPENLKATILDPIQELMGNNRQSTSPLRTYKTPGGGIIGVDAVTGTTRQLSPNAPPKTPDMSYAEKQRIASLYRDRNAVLSKPSYQRNAEDQKRLDDVTKAIAVLEQPAAAPLAPTLERRQPALGADWPIQGSFIGTPGGTNSFSGTNNPFIPPATATKRLRFNEKTGNFY